MSRIKNQPVGKTIQGAPTSDINQKLTYQQLLRRNHEFEKENAQLKNIGIALNLSCRHQIGQLAQIATHTILNQAKRIKYLTL